MAADSWRGEIEPPLFRCGHLQSAVAASPEQARAALWREIGAGLIEIFRSDPAVAPELARLEAAVVAGSEIPLAAARHLLEAFARRPA